MISVIWIDSLRAATHHPLQIAKELRISFSGALRISDDHIGRSQASQGEAHRHAVIVVGVDLGPANIVRWRNRQAVVKLLDRRAELSQLRRGGADAISLLVANVAHV